MLVVSQVQVFLDDTDYLEFFQSGYWLGLRPQTACSRRRLELCMILPDISAAFDTINHSILLGHLDDSASAEDWNKNFIEIRL